MYVLFSFFFPLQVEGAEYTPQYTFYLFFVICFFLLEGVYIRPNALVLCVYLIILSFCHLGKSLRTGIRGSKHAIATASLPIPTRYAFPT